MLGPDRGLLPGPPAATRTFLATAACSVGRGLDAKAEKGWLWNGQRVYVFDGTTVTMSDTPANQAAYPQVYNQGPGVGSPIARLGAVFSLARGAVVALGFSRYAGKGQGEVSLLRRLWDVLRPGDVLLGDRLMSSWVGMHLLKERGVDTVSRLSAHRRADFRKGARLGKDDHIVVWPKPNSIRSMDRRAYHALPDEITVREASFRVDRPGYRTRSVVVATTLLDPAQATRDDLAALYRARWHAEKSQADCTSRRRWVCAGRIGYHRRDGVARTGRVVPATSGRPHRRSRMPDTTRRPAPPRA